MLFEIKSRLNGSVLFSLERGSLRLCVEAAVRGGVSLAYANLTDADLTCADLTCANLRGANLIGANLTGANLTRADLTGAELRGANLTGAELTGANLTCADLTGADLTGAELTCANLTNVMAEVRIPSLHRRILAAIDNGGTLDMATWHSCETTHCRAGWAINLAGKAGRMLELCLGSAVAGAIIHLASCPQLEGKVPDFYASNEDALNDIRRLAALEPELEPASV